MKQLIFSFAGLLRDQRGATAIEYALIALLISIVIVAAATQIGASVSSLVASVLPGLQGS